MKPTLSQVHCHAGPALSLLSPVGRNGLATAYKHML